MCKMLLSIEKYVHVYISKFKTVLETYDLSMAGISQTQIVPYLHDMNTYCAMEFYKV